ncbi:MAG: hypothetical protein ABEI74_01920 [Candidatus Pacearchaeota archaeon]
MDNIDHFETGKGSVYKYLPNWKTQRFKKIENETKDPSDAIVFIPNYEWFQENINTDITKTLGNNEEEMNQIFLEYIHSKPGRTYINDSEGKILRNNMEIHLNQGPTLLSFVKNKELDFYIPVAKDPRIGFQPYDTRTYQKNGTRMRSSHIGHKVTSIHRKADNKYSAQTSFL